MLELPRSTYYANRDTLRGVDGFLAKYQHLKSTVQDIIEANPAYGYRRIITELKTDHHIIINHKPLQILLKLWGLSLNRSVSNSQKSGILNILEFLGVRANLLKALGDITPFSLIYSDMTEINYAHGKLYLQIYLDHITKKVLGYAIGKSPNTELVLKAFKIANQSLKLEFGKLTQKPKEIIFHQDQGSINTSYAYVKALLDENYTLSYSRPATPTDNPEMESWNGRFKTENKQLFMNAETPEELEQLVYEQILYYNQKRRHSSLQNISPNNFINLLTAKAPSLLS